MKVEPVFFERNRVGRVYTGGKLFHGFFGDEAIDGFQPEEWVASSVAALNKEMACEKEGVQFCVYAYNAQPGILIDYQTGDSREE